MYCIAGFKFCQHVTLIDLSLYFTNTYEQQILQVVCKHCKKEILKRKNQILLTIFLLSVLQREPPRTSIKSQKLRLSLQQKNFKILFIEKKQVFKFKKKQFL